MTPWDRKSEKIERHGEQKSSQGRPKWAKAHQKWARGEPKAAKMQPRGAKREPNVSQRATKMHPKVDLRKRTRKGCQKAFRIFVIWVDFGCHFPSQIHEKSMWKSMPEKSWKLMKNRCGYEATSRSFPRSVFIKKRLFRKRRMYGNYMYPRVKWVSARVRPKKENQKNEKRQKQNIQK